MTRNVSIAEFRSFIDDQRTKIANAFREVEQAQAEFQGAYTRFKADHDKTLAQLVNRFVASTDGLGATLKAQIDARVPEEHTTIVQRISVLNNELAHLQTQADNLVARGQKELADLREINPKLNEREEDSKNQVTRWQQTLDDLNQQVSRLSRGLGFVFNAFKIHSLDRERFRAVGQLEALDAQLRQVRKEWQDLRAMATKNESDWQSDWQSTMAKIAQWRAERDFLVQNTDAEARRRAITFSIDNLKKLPSDADAQSLQPMIDLNIQTDDFQAALGSVAGILGALHGVDDGLGRMNESVKAIIDEQNRNSTYLHLPSVNIPDTALQFGTTWDTLADKTRDEKSLAQHPADFVAAMKSFLNDRLNEKQIVAFFNSLGGALQAATQGWKGS